MDYPNFPNITWPQFKVCNDDSQTEFENMCRQLFTYEFLKDSCIPHSNPNNPGVEVEPVLEPARSDKKPQRKISFQAKFFEGKADYRQIKESAQKAVKSYKDNLDLIYLFCNCAISTHNRSYRSIERLLSGAGIELYPISNTELLDLVRKYPTVANYYFRNRERANDLSSLPAMQLRSPDLSTTGDSLTRTEDVVTTTQPTPDNSILIALYQDKVKNFRNDILELRLNNLDSKIQKLLPSNAKLIDGMDTLMFYHFLLNVHSNNSVELGAIREKLAPVYYNDAEWMLTYSAEPKNFSLSEFVRLLPETQVILLNKMFSDQSWSDIIDLSQKAEQAQGVLAECVTKQLQLLCALSLFNQRKYDVACERLDELYARYHTDKIEFFRVCAHIQKINSEFIYGSNQCHFDLVNYLKIFEDIKNRAPDHFNQNLILAANLEIVSYRNLSEGDVEQLKQVFDRYENYSETVRNNPTVKFQIALCYEMAADFEHALSIYSSFEDQNDESVMARKAFCNIQLKRYEEAIRLYSDVDINRLSPRAQGECLLALSYGGSGQYCAILDAAINRNRSNVIDLFYIAYYVRDERLFCEKIVPVLQDLLQQDVDAFSQVSMPERNGYLLVLAHFNQIELVKAILDSVHDISSIDAFIISTICHSLFVKLNEYIEKPVLDKISITQIYISDKIADYFLSYKPGDVSYIQIKMMCARLNRMSLSELKFAKQIFEQHPNKFLASRIIQLLQGQRETASVEYDRYLEMFKESDNAEDAIYVAQLSARLGRESDAKLYLYKAFYKLNGIDNYTVYSHALIISCLAPEIFNAESTDRKITGSSVIVLEPEQPVENALQSQLLKICLDSEKDFSDADNKSLDMQHFSKDSKGYVKLLGVTKNQTVKLGKIRYKVVDILPRHTYIRIYLNKKMQDAPQKFNNNAVHLFSGSSAEEAISQIKQYLDSHNFKAKHIEASLKMYNFENFEWGIPIDAFVAGDYQRYIGIAKYLLYAEDQAFYAGEPSEFNGSAYCVPTLSTFVLLCLIDKLNVLDGIKDKLIIPESYLSFLNEQYAKAVQAQKNSEGQLASIDGELAFLELDEQLPSIWEKILDFCNDLPRESVSNDERIEQDFIEGCTLEKLMAPFGAEKVQLDSFVLAKRKNAIYLCDDLFFRKVANIIGIQSINCASLLRNMVEEEADAITVELSKTNYIYIPLDILSNEKYAKEVMENLLHGKQKEKYYGACFHILSLLMNGEKNTD